MQQILAIHWQEQFMRLRRSGHTSIIASVCCLCHLLAALPLHPQLIQQFQDPIEPICALPIGDFSPGIPQPEGTRRMIDRLAKIRLELLAEPQQVPFQNAELAQFIERSLKAAYAARDWSSAISLHPQLAQELLQDGQSIKALRTIKGFYKNARSLGHQFEPRFARQLSLLQILCHLRIGEQQNCLTNHTSESCLIPIRENGVHRLPQGSQAAAKLLTEHLRQLPGDLHASWLLNITHMTMGTYPGGVPAQHLIPPQIFASDYDIKRFSDIAGLAGLDVDDLAGGSVIDDFDGDGFLDVMASSWGFDGQLRFFKNNGDGSFTEQTAAAGLNGLVSGLHIMQTDYNNDGWIDVFVPRGAWLMQSGHHPNSLLKNRGDGTFEDVTEAAGLLSFHPTQTATWFDFNGDGWLDLFIGNESLPSDPHPCELYRNNRDGTFTEIAAASGLTVHQYIKGVNSGDFDNDGDPDLFLSNRIGPNLLFRNDGPSDDVLGWKFTDVSKAAGVTEPHTSFPAWFFDFDNDGWLDIFVSGYNIRDAGDSAADYLGLPTTAERARLFKNKRDGTFSDVTSESGLYKVLHSMGANFGDLDNDGWLDFYLGTGDPSLGTLIPNRMFRNADGKFFQDVTSSGGFGHIQKGHGISFADLDHDGDQDIYAVMGGAFSGDNYRNALFQNPGHGNRWLKLSLEGVRSNRAAIGARIRIVLQTPDGDRELHRTVGTGASFGANPLRQEIGLGKALSIKKVEVYWPSAKKTQIFENLAMDHFYKIREGDPNPTQLQHKQFQLGAAGLTQVPHPPHASSGI